MTRSSEPVTINNVKAVRETEKALLIQYVVSKRGGEEKVDTCWVPKSQIVEDESDVVELNDEGDLIVSKWFADKAGLPYEEGPLD